MLQHNLSPGTRCATPVPIRGSVSAGGSNIKRRFPPPTRQWHASGKRPNTTSPPHDNELVGNAHPTRLNGLHGPVKILPYLDLSLPLKEIDRR